MIQVDHLTKRYGERVVVSDVSFSVKKGEIVGFLGPNGAGKSTTLRMLTGFLEPTAGAIKVDGIDAFEDPVGARQRIGYMPEASPLYPEMRVIEYLRYRAELKGVARRQIASRVDAALELAGVADSRTRIIGQLSKGYRQRVGLADALVADPPLLVLDEPTAGLDPNQIRQVRDLVKGLAGKKTIFLSTHILPEVEATCERVVIIHKGRIVGEGTPEAMRERAQARSGTVLIVLGRGAPAAYVEALRAAAHVKSAVTTAIEAGAYRTAGGLVRVRVETDGDAAAGESVAAAVVGAGLPLRELREEQASLEDVFTSLTTEDAAAQTEAEDADDDEDGDEDADEADGESGDEKDRDDGSKKEGAS